jgi:antitoxin MazE
MRVSKRGGSLAVRIPADVVRALGLKEGDELDMTLLDERRVELIRKRGIEEHLPR